MLTVIQLSFFLLQMFFKRQSGGFYGDLLKVYGSAAPILRSHTAKLLL